MKHSSKHLAAAALLGLAILPIHSAHATVGDLVTNTTVSIDTIYGSAIFTRDFSQPTGTGVFEPFLTLQANGTEQGYNTSAKNGVFDTKREPQWNQEIRLSDLSTVTIAGSQYYSFLIDINEPDGQSFSQISLDGLKIFTSTVAGQTTTNVESLGTKRFDLDLPSDSYILYDDQNSGSGQGDIAFFIPTSAFIGASQTDYIYMYQLWGQHVGANFDGTTQGGFEETAIGAGVKPVPEVSTLLPLAGMLGIVLGTNYYRRRKSVVA